MSRTRRKLRKFSEDFNSIVIKEGGDAQVSHGWVGNRKMKPYIREGGQHKFRASKTEYVSGLYKGVSQHDKLVTQNANRSLKKGVRQQHKLELKDIHSQIDLINELDSDII